MRWNSQRQEPSPLHPCFPFNNLGKPSPKSKSVTVHIDQIPDAPQTVLVSPGDTVLTVMWEPSGEDDVVGYNIYRDNIAAPLNNELIPETKPSPILRTQNREN